MKTKFWIILIAAILILSTLSGLLLLSPGKVSDRAEIRSEGKTLHIVDLRLDQTFTITTAAGGHNVVTVKDGKIAVTEANCPDHYCMDRGYANSGSQIVCLPNKLVIQFLGKQEVDGVVG